MPTVTRTFVQAKFVHIDNILAVSDQILTKSFGPNFLGLSVFKPIFWTKIAFDKNFFDHKHFLDQIFFGVNFGGPEIFLTKFVFRDKSFCIHVFLPKFI